MRFLADENVPKILVDRLLMKSQDVYWIKLQCPGKSDREIFNIAQSQNRIIITFDRDYGELIFRFRLKADAGIILLRFWMVDSLEMADKIADVLCDREDWGGCFSVIEPDKIRIRKLPE